MAEYFVHVQMHYHKSPSLPTPQRSSHSPALRFLLALPLANGAPQLVSRGILHRHHRLTIASTCALCLLHCLPDRLYAHLQATLMINVRTKEYYTAGRSLPRYHWVATRCTALCVVDLDPCALTTIQLLHQVDAIRFQHGIAPLTERHLCHRQHHPGHCTTLTIFAN